VTVGKIDITKTLARVEEQLSNDPSISLPLRSMIELLVTIIQLLAAKLGLNSSNSSIPPSQDPRRKRGGKGNGERKPGGQKGHPGTTLEPVKDPDRIEPLEVDRGTLPPGSY